MRFALILSLLFAALSAGASETIPALLTAGGYVSVFAKGNSLETTIPRIRIYSASGLEVADYTGYSAAMREFIDAALIQDGKPGARKLVDLIPLLTKPDGKRFELADLPKNERVIVTFGAEWCGPCHVLKADLKKMEGFTVLEVDADNRRIGTEAIMKAFFAGQQR